MIIASAALAAATLAPATVPLPPEEAQAIEAVVLDAFVAELEADAIDYQAPACAWTLDAEVLGNSLWTCYAIAEGVWLAPVLYIGETASATVTTLIKYSPDPLG